MGRQRQRQRERLQRERQQNSPTPKSSRGRPATPPPSGPSRGMIAAGILVVVAALAIFGYAATRPGSKSNNNATAGQKLGASATSTAAAAASAVASAAPTSSSQQTTAKPVDGIGCGTMEALAYHIHQHLALYDNGKPVQVPALIGIPLSSRAGKLYATCFYWIHVHQETPGIIHVESPLKKTFHLGNFFDIWAKTRSTTFPPGDSFLKALQAAASRHQVTAYYNGKLWKGSYRSIPLKEHGVIQIEIGKPVVPFQPFSNWKGL